jgi:hypothetical protein
LASLAFLNSCEKKEEENKVLEDPIIAQIGDEFITMKEFRASYETGFGNLKSGPDSKMTFLKHMINERLIALEGFRLGFAESETVKLNERLLQHELMIEKLLDREIKSKLKVTPEEIRIEINKSKVSFKFRYWVEPTLEKARIIAGEMRERGYAEVLDDIMYNNPERKIIPQKYETDYLTYLEVPAEVMDAIKDLPYGDISKPQEINGKFFIFQVLDIRRSGITENEYAAKASRFEQIAFYQRFQEELARFTEHLLTPKKIVTKRESFNLLSNALEEWLTIHPEKRLSLTAQIKRSAKDKPALQKMGDNLNTNFFTYQDGTVSIAELLKYFDEFRFKDRLNNTVKFKDVLQHEVQSTIRNYFFVQKAAELDLRSSPEVQRDINIWRNKWVYNETRRYLSQNIEVSEQQVLKYFEDNKSRYKIRKDDNPKFSVFAKQAKQDAYLNELRSILDKKIESLKDQYPIDINEAALDTTTVMDFQKSRWANIQIFRAGTNRPVYPTVDPVWGVSR